MFDAAQKITVRYVPHTEAPGRPVRIDYGSLAHEYVTRLDAIEINRDSTLGIRCKEATGLEPDWVEQGMSEAYSQLAAILTTLDAPEPAPEPWTPTPGEEVLVVREWEPRAPRPKEFPDRSGKIGEYIESCPTDLLYPHRVRVGAVCFWVHEVAPAPAQEKVTDEDLDGTPYVDEDFDLFPAKPGPIPSGDFEVRKDADGGFTVLGGCKVSDDDGGRPCPPEHETAIDFEDPVSDLAMDLRAPGSDPVHAPSHYTDGGIETIDYLRAKLSREAFVGFCQGNALKYLSRAGKKGSAAEDFAKAAVYCRWAEEASR